MCLSFIILLIETRFIGEHFRILSTVDIGL